jgi:gamma-glutamyltranspeptidase/glutathione hydrolase
VRRLAAAVLLLSAVIASAAGADLTSQSATGRGGAVAAEESTAAGVGLAVLRKGGNATDAAVAMAFALAVTWPEAGNVGGGGFWISRNARGLVSTIDFRERAPRAARRDMFDRDAAGGGPRSSSEGPLASAVPGSVAGLSLAHRRAGRMPWKDLVDPAVRLARDGFVMTENVRDSIAAKKTKLAADPETAAIFLPAGEPPEAGSLFRQPALARTLEAIRDRREDGFYRGRVAREIELEQKAAGGLITRGDLALYAPKVRRSASFRFGNAQVFTTGAPSSGPALMEMVLLAQAVGSARVRPGDAEAVHLLAEVEKRAFYDRNRYLGDPDFGGVRQDLFASADRLRRLARSIDPGRATPSEALRRIESADGSTTHYSVADAQGNVVAVTTTLNDAFGNGRVARRLGFLWNNEMDDFTALPGQPNLNGLVQGETNAVAPGKRMLSSMCPVIAVLPDGSVFAFGSAGGATILTTNFQVLLGLVLRGDSLAQAVAAPRFHQQDAPDVLEVEDAGFDGALIAALEEMGHTVKVSTRSPVPGKMGRAHAVAARGTTTEAVADPRRHGAALVVEPAP